MPQSSLTTVNNLIEDAFGDDELNKVNFKLITGVLMILAKELHLLERRFFVKCEWLAKIPSPQISVTEIRFQALEVKQQSEKIIRIAETPAEISREMARAAYQAKLGRTQKSKSEKPEKKVLSTHSASASRLPDISSTNSSISSAEVSTDKISKTTSKISTTGTATTTATSPGKHIRKDNSFEKSEYVKDTGNKSASDTGRDKLAETNKTTSPAVNKKAPKKEKILILETKVDQQSSSSVSSSRESISREAHTAPLHASPYREVPSRESPEGWTAENIQQSQRLSVATKQQFEALLKSVADLSQRYGVALSGVGDFTETLVGSKFYKKTSLTDPMAVLQLAARLEIVEKSADQIIKLLIEINQDIPTTTTEQPKSKEAEVNVIKDPENDLYNTEAELGQTASLEKPESFVTQVMAKEDSYGTGEKETATSGLDTNDRNKQQTATSKMSDTVDESPMTGQPDAYIKTKSGTTESISESQAESTKEIQGQDDERKLAKGEYKQKTYITQDDLKNTIQDFSIRMVSEIKALSNRYTARAKQVSKKSVESGKKLKESLNLPIDITELKDLVSNYTDRISRLDVFTTGKMVEYQEMLTQMTYNLEAGVKAMNEAISVPDGQTSTEEKDLIVQFIQFQAELDDTPLIQNDLQIQGDIFLQNLRHLRQEVSQLDVLKATREQAEEQIAYKAGIKDLNALVDCNYFLAIKGAWEKQIRSTNEKMNCQEYTWQRKIDEVFRDITKRAERRHLVGLRESINFNTEKLKEAMKSMSEIISQPREQITARPHIEGSCFSCYKHWHDTKGLLPAIRVANLKLSKKSISQGTSSDVSKASQHVCYPGYNIPHPLHPRSQVCSRICGQSTKVDNWASPTLPAPSVLKLVRNPKSKGVLDMAKKSCIPCNKKETKQSRTEQACMGILRQSTDPPFESAVHLIDGTSFLRIC